MPRLEVWLDKFSGHRERKFAACFVGSRKGIRQFVSHVSKTLLPVRTISRRDIFYLRTLSVRTAFQAKEFTYPVLENHADGTSYFSIYENATGSKTKALREFVLRAASFFEDAVRAQPNSQSKEETSEVYPRLENRKSVTSHLRRERSSYLATECKLRDNYICQICRFGFEKKYGKLGSEFAECHHIYPLAKLNVEVKTYLKDLVTVCSNCHRMLHRMNGQPSDINRLKRLISGKHR